MNGDIMVFLFCCIPDVLLRRTLVKGMPGGEVPHTVVHDVNFSREDAVSYAEDFPSSPSGMTGPIPDAFAQVLL